MEVDYYELLGVPVDASLAQIQSSYLARLQRLYDSAQSSGPLERASAMEQMDLLRRAFATLSDPDRRSSYDQSRSQVQKTSTPGATPFCPRCGGEVRATAHFCPRCGASLRPVEGLPLNLAPAVPVAAAPKIQSSPANEQPGALPVTLPEEPLPAVPPQVPQAMPETYPPTPEVQPVIQDALPPPIPPAPAKIPAPAQPGNRIIGLTGQIEYSPVMELNRGYTLSIRFRLLPAQPDLGNGDAEQARLATMLANESRPLVRVIAYSPHLLIVPPYQDVAISPETEGAAQFSHSLQRQPSGVEDLPLHIAFHTQGEKLGETIIPIAVAGALTGGTSQGRRGLGTGLTITGVIMATLLLLIGIYNMISYYLIVPYAWLLLLLLIALGLLGAGIYLRKKSDQRMRTKF